LRSLKSVLATSGDLKRNLPKDNECDLLLKALKATIAPKLVQQDKVKYDSILSSLFTNIKIDNDPKVREMI